MKTKTGLHIETRKNRIEVYTPKELEELNELIKENKKRNFNILVALLMAIVFIAGYTFGSR